GLADSSSSLQDVMSRVLNRISANNFKFFININFLFFPLY
ncbi:MAG: hypothetical protein ACJAT1_000988, partial [Marivirga sp.]